MKTNNTTELIDQLSKEINKLQAQYNACTTRRVYHIGKALRTKQAELKALKDGNQANTTL